MVGGYWWIAFGVFCLVYRFWWLPRQMGRVRDRVERRGAANVERFDAVMRSPWYVVAANTAGVLGGLFVVLGVLDLVAWRRSRILPAVKRALSLGLAVVALVAVGAATASLVTSDDDGGEASSSPTASGQRVPLMNTLETCPRSGSTALSDGRACVQLTATATSP
jgi:hypothetical protein